MGWRENRHFPLQQGPFRGWSTPPNTPNPVTGRWIEAKQACGGRRDALRYLGPTGAPNTTIRLLLRLLRSDWLEASGSHTWPGEASSLPSGSTHEEGVRKL